MLRKLENYIRCWQNIVWCSMKSLEVLESDIVEEMQSAFHMQLQLMMQPWNKKQ